MSRVAEPSPQGQQQQQQQQQQAPRSRLVQRLLDASASLPSFLNDLVTTQAVVVAGTEAAAFLLERAENNEVRLRPVVHIRPDDSDAQTRAAALQAFQSIVTQCLQQGKDGAIDVGSPDGGEPQFCLVTLLRNESQVVGVSAVVTRARDAERARQRLTSMQLVAGYFELYSLRRTVEEARTIADQHQQILQYAGAVAMAEGFHAAALALCNELATRLSATRVALGWVKGVKIKVKALSHTEKFDKKQELIVQLEKAMEECLDQEEPVAYDPAGKRNTANVNRMARELSRSQGGNMVLSVPLRRRDRIVGVLTVEWSPEQQVDDRDEAGVAVAADLLAPQLSDRYDNDRYIITKVGHSIRNLAKLAIGPKYTGTKLLIAFGLALAVFVVSYRPMYHARAAVVLQAQEIRTICAPFDGILEEVNYRPGQAVTQGAVIARLRTTDLEVKLAAALAQAQSKAVAADKARQEGKPAEQRIAEAERDEALRQADLLKYYIEQASLRAPVTGVLMKGDLFDRRGMPVRQGEPLFEMGRSDPANPTRLAVEAELQIADRDVQEVALAMQRRRAGGDGELIDGHLAATSYPGEDYKFTISRLVPMSEAKDGDNIFKAYAVVHDPAPWMQPGLTGEARIDIERRSLLWVWTHRLVDWIRLKLWI